MPQGTMVQNFRELCFVVLLVTRMVAEEIKILRGKLKTFTPKGTLCETALPRELWTPSFCPLNTARNRTTNSACHWDLWI